MYFYTCPVLVNKKECVEKYRIKEAKADRAITTTAVYAKENVHIFSF